MLRREDLIFNRGVQAGDYVLFCRFSSAENKTVLDVGIVGNFYKEGEPRIMINNIMRLPEDIIFILNYKGYQKQLKLYTPSFNAIRNKFYDCQ